jgi:hypothetical protein
MKALLLFLALCSTQATAASYRWVDENNHVHYSDQPPGNHKTAKLLPSASNTSATSTPAAGKTLVERAADLKKSQQTKQKDADKATQKQAMEETIKANCAAAQQNLATLQNSPRLTVYSANGERSFLTDEQLQERIAQAQQQISDYCK